MVEKQVSVAVRGGAEVGDGGVLQGTAAAVECDGERARRVVGAQVGGRHEEPSPRHAGSVGARQGFARFAGQRALGPLGDHLIVSINCLLSGPSCAKRSRPAAP
jgi:hypothetical protein